MNLVWLDDRQRRVLWRCAFIIAGALVLLWTPILNGYPLIHADSGTYIWSSVIFIVPVDRPIWYSLFIRAASPVISLWSVIVVQALGTSYLIQRAAELLLPPTPRRDLYAFGILFATVLTRAVSAQVGMVLADLFASWLLLAGIVFVFTRHPYEKVLAGFLMVLALLIHNSHVYIVLAVLGVLGVMILFSRSWWKRYSRALAGLLLLVGIAVVSALGVNLYLRAGPTVGRGTNTFIVNRLEQSGILTRTLDTYCADTHWVLCDYREAIRTHPGGGGWFLWSPDSPLGKLGWEQSAAEHDSILRYAVQCCVSTLVQASAVASWRQFWLVGSTAPIGTLTQDMNAVLAIQKNYPHEFTAFQNSAQQQGRSIYTRLFRFDERVETAGWLTLAIVLGVLAWRLRRSPLPAVWVTLAVLLVVNAIIVASVSGPSVRYQERVFWLVPFCVLVSAVALLAQGRPVSYLHRGGAQTTILQKDSGTG